MLRNYLKIALKVLGRRKFFTAISLFCISFTLVTMMVIAAMLDHVLAPMEPEVNLRRSLRCHYMELRGDESRRSGNPGYMFLDRYVRALPGAEAVTLFSTQNAAVTYVADHKVVSQVRRTDAEYWRVLRFRFVEGGPFAAQDDRDGSSVAVINQATRKRIFGEATSALGRSVELDGQTFKVVGVVENVPAYRQTAYADVWVPIGSLRSDRYRNELMGGFEAVVLARRQSDLPRLQAEFDAMLPRVELTHPETYKEMRGKLRTYAGSLAHEVLPGGSDASSTRTRELVLVLIAGGLLFMWLPAMNLININISRIFERSSEIGVRKAFGASSRSLVAQFVLENVLLCVLGGAVALGLSWVALRAIGQAGLIPYANLGLNLRLFAVGLGLAAFFGVLSGVYPAWRMSRMHPVSALRGSVS